MNPSRSRLRPIVGSIVVAIGLLALAGCQEDQITYTVVPRAAEPEKTRLVGVIYPHGDTTWFFKLTGPEGGFEGMDKPFNEFMESVRFTDKDDPPVTWTTPADWEKEKAPPPLYAAFEVGAADKPLKLTVAKLPAKKENEVLDNVNRWRGQLGLEAAADLDALRKSKEIQEDKKFNGAAVTVVDMIGAAHKLGGMGPLWTYQKPDGWVEVPATERKGVVPQLAVFKVTEGDQTAEASVTALGGAAGGLEQNVQRWCNQIEAPPVAPDKINEATITVGGRKSPYLDLTGKRGRTVGAIVAVGDKTWFFKLNGPAELVGKQKPKFEEFLKSVKFAGGGGDEQ
ncbi:MAG TPA: hypothetical protein VMS17_07870 [Gemmataceae bacterium]|nr:hypothetical protein [Gemmataceae bacterium]